MGGTDISDIEKNPQQVMNDLDPKSEQMFQLYTDAVNSYTNSMNTYITNANSIPEERELMVQHNVMKKQALSQFRLKTPSECIAAAAEFQKKVDSDIELKYEQFSKDIEIKRTNFITEAGSHNETLVQTIWQKYLQSAQQAIENQVPYMEESEITNLSGLSKNSALREFESQRMGDVEMSHPQRRELQSLLANLHATLKQQNDLKRKAYSKNPADEQRAVNTTVTGSDKTNCCVIF